MKEGAAHSRRVRFARLARGLLPAAWVLALAVPAAGALAAMREGAEAGAAAEVAQVGPRPFKHDRHARLACAECHGSGRRHGAIRVRTARDCAACHHDARRDYTCTGCHARATLPARGVPSPMALTVWPEPRLRTLPFAHARHADVACRSCHVTPVTLAPGVECRSCHQDHHRPEAECAQCHRETVPPVHRRESHLGCAGSTCHAPALRERLTMSGNLCLVCHSEQRDHEPGRNCATCHILSRPPAPAREP